MGKLLGFLRVNGKNRISKECECRKRKQHSRPRDSEASCHCAIEDKSPLVAHQMKHRVSLRSNTIGESVRMKCGMVAQTEPGTILLRSLGHGGFFPGGKVVP